MNLCNGIGLVGVDGPMIKPIVLSMWVMCVSVLSCGVQFDLFCNDGSRLRCRSFSRRSNLPPDAQGRNCISLQWPRTLDSSLIFSFCWQFVRLLLVVLHWSDCNVTLPSHTKIDRLSSSEQFYLGPNLLVQISDYSTGTGILVRWSRLYKFQTIRINERVKTPLEH
jgi:hypothetical protein